MLEFLEICKRHWIELNLLHDTQNKLTDFKNRQKLTKCVYVLTKNLKFKIYISAVWNQCEILNLSSFHLSYLAWLILILHGKLHNYHSRIFNFFEEFCLPKYVEKCLINLWNFCNAQRGGETSSKGAVSPPLGYATEVLWSSPLLIYYYPETCIQYGSTHQFIFKFSKSGVTRNISIKFTWFKSLI